MKIIANTVCFLMTLTVLLNTAKGSFRKIGCTLITEISLKTAKCININLVKLPKNVETDVQILHLHKNQITSLEDDSFDGMYSLQNLHLSENWISYVSENAFKSLQNLQNLYLNNNMMKNVPKTSFKFLKQLRLLDFSYNPITRITSDDFTYLLNLETLKFENCQLISIDPSSFDWLPNLYEINIIGNQLTALNWRLKSSLQRVSVLRLHNNPWNCNCHLKWLRITVNKVPNWSFGNNSPVCNSPSLLSGVFWKHLGAEKFACASIIVTTAEKFNNSSNFKISLGSNGSLECEAWGDPIPEIIWMKANKKINYSRLMSKNEQVKIENNQIDVGEQNTGVKSTLTFLDFRKTDVDNYKCVAINPAGRSEVTYQVWATEKDSASNQKSKKLKLNLTFEVVVGMVLGTFILVGCLLFCLLFVINKQQNSKKNLKKRNPNNKHQQLLYNEKNFKMVNGEEEWGDKFIDVTLEYDGETKEGSNFKDESDKITIKNPSNKKLQKKMNTEKSFKSWKSKKTFHLKDKLFFTKYDKSSKIRDEKKYNQPGILKYENPVKINNKCLIYNNKLPQNSTQLSPYSLEPVFCEHLCQHLTNITHCSTSRASTSFTPCPSADTTQKHLHEINVTSDSKKIFSNASANGVSPLVYNFPNSNRVPLKTILKQPSKNFNEKKENRENLSEDVTSCLVTNSSSFTQKYPQKCGRPPDIYATLPSRVGDTDSNCVNMNENKAISEKIGKDDFSLDGQITKTELFFNEKNKNAKEVFLPTDQHIYNKQVINLPTASAEENNKARLSSLENYVSYAISDSSSVKVFECANTEKNSSHLQNTDNILHQNQPPQPFLEYESALAMHATSQNFPNFASELHEVNNDRCKYHCMFSSPQQKAPTQPLPKCYPNSQDVREAYDAPTEKTLNKKKNVSSSTSLHQVLSPPFKKKFSPTQAVKRTDNKKSQEMKYHDFGTAV